MGLFKKDERTNLQKLLKKAQWLSARDLVFMLFFIYLVLLHERKKIPQTGITYISFIAEIIIVLPKSRIKSDVDEILAQVDALLSPQYMNDAISNMSKGFVNGFGQYMIECSLIFAALGMFVVDGKYNASNGVYRQILQSASYFNQVPIHQAQKSLNTPNYIEDLNKEYMLLFNASELITEMTNK